MCAGRGEGAAPEVAIVDDDPSVSRALIRLCRSAGYSFRAFASAEEFLAESREREPACLILDVHLPGANGLELQRRIVAEGRRIPIVFITAFEGAASRERALASGALAFLEKPLDNEQLLGVLRGAVNREEENGA